MLLFQQAAYWILLNYSLLDIALDSAQNNPHRMIIGFEFLSFQCILIEHDHCFEHENDTFM